MDSPLLLFLKLFFWSYCFDKERSFIPQLQNMYLKAKCLRTMNLNKVAAQTDWGTCRKIVDIEASKKMEQSEEEVSDCQRKLKQAAEFGQILLEQNEDLKLHMDQMRKAYDTQIELVEQDKHAIQMKLDQKCSLEAWYDEEIRLLKQQLADGEDNLRESLTMDNKQEVSKLTRKIDELVTDLDEAANVESLMKHKITELEDLFKEKLNKSEANLCSSSDGSSEEALQDQVDSLQNELTSFKSQLIEKKSELNMAVSKIDTLHGRLNTRDQELDDVKCQFISVNNALEHMRVEKLDLKCQLDALLMETSCHRKKGNSIFSELDDRRVDAESKLIKFHVANQTLREKYNVEKQQNNKYKRQISQLLLQMSGGRVDSEYVASIECNLAQARQELKALIEEKTQSEDQQACQLKFRSELSEVTASDSDYSQYLVTVLEGKDGEIQKIKNELNCKTLQLLDEKCRTGRQEANIVQLETEKDKLRSHNMKISVKLEELRQKYEPDSVKKSGVLVVKRTETIALDDQHEVNITETSHLRGNTSSNQSQIRSHRVRARPIQPLVEKVENIQDRSIKSEKSALLKCLKTKSVAISDDVEQYEMEKELDLKAASQNKPKLQQKGRTLTAVKHISAQNSKTLDVNECKSQ